MEAIPELLQMTNDELEDLLCSEHKMDSFLETLPDIAAIINKCEQLSDENQVLASSNLQKEKEFETARDFTIKKVEELAQVHQHFENLTKEHQQLSEKLSPANLQESMIIAASQSEEESEEIAEEFLQKNIDIDTFLDKYRSKRLESHLRKFKGDRLGTQLQELHKAGF